MNSGFTNNWDDLLDLLPAHFRDVYFSSEYQNLYANLELGEKALCFSYQESTDVFLLPLIIKPYMWQDEVWFDAESAYGYGGPISSSTDSEFLGRAQEALMQSCKTEKIFCVFLRFHPLMANQKLLRASDNLTLFFDRSTVAINLELLGDDIWEQEIHSKHRNVIRKARENGLTVSFDAEFLKLTEFKELYRRTMDKLSAADMYYFSDDYFRQLTKNLSENSCLCLVHQDDKLIAACILFWGETLGHYHLSGSDLEALHLYPNNLMLYEAALFLRQKGLKAFHLGGGTSSDPSNSLFKFKQRFSQKQYEFWLGKLITMPDLYQNICKDWREKNPEKVESFGRLLQCYRY